MPIYKWIMQVMTIQSTSSRILFRQLTTLYESVQMNCFHSMLSKANWQCMIQCSPERTRQQLSLSMQHQYSPCPLAAHLITTSWIFVCHGEWHKLSLSSFETSCHCLNFHLHHIQVVIRTQQRVDLSNNFLQHYATLNFGNVYQTNRCPTGRHLWSSSLAHSVWVWRPAIFVLCSWCQVH